VVALESPAIARRSATLNGTVDPRGLSTTYHFEYGTTTSYGLSTPPASAGAGNGAQPVSADLSGLEPDTTYHYRLVATNADGTAVSAGRVLTTAALPAGGGPPPLEPAIIPPALAPAAPITLIPPALPPVEPFTIIAPATLRLDRGGAVTIRIAFPAGTPAVTGRAEVVRGRAAARIGAKPFATKPGGTVRVRIRVTRAARRMVARRKQVNATLRVTVQAEVQTKQIRLERRRR
jgi:hypothetical protein